MGSGDQEAEIRTTTFQDTVLSYARIETGADAVYGDRSMAADAYHWNEFAWETGTDAASGVNLEATPPPSEAPRPVEHPRPAEQRMQAERRLPANPNLPAGPTVRRLDSFISRPTRWLWPGRVALGQLTIVAGEPGAAPVCS